jgi:alpha-amylase/alpha-mannosidase (GH57 family)
VTKSIVIHGHFYQPPRDDPWSGIVPQEYNAAPDHDWNERITRECYAPVAPSLAALSFDFGPTLLAWMEHAAPATYAAVLAADRASAAQHDGHGSAVAMPYHHSILPLSSRRDKTTEVRWGIADFRRRFGREPEGMWLPETAVDDETLDVLAAEGIRFTVLAPHQVERAPGGGLPGWYRTGGGHRIALFLYDGGISHGVSFGPLVRDAGAWVERLTSAQADLVTIATDGETYGHHHNGGDATLARVLEMLGQRGDVRLENFASFLARRPPEEQVRLVAPSSWSCPHGVERWRAECGCRAAPEKPTQQRWRAPLRGALDWLAGELRGAYDRDGGGRAMPHELEHQMLRMFTSCGWFFDDIAGLETVIVLRSAARAIDLAGQAGVDAARLEAGLLERLAAAPSNDPSVGSGRELYLQRAKAA